MVCLGQVERYTRRVRSEFTELHQRGDLTMILMSLCIAPEIYLFVTELYDGMLASGLRIVMFCNASITEAALVRAWVHIYGGVAACAKHGTRACCTNR